MLSFLVLALNFAALAGVFAGLVLQAPPVRQALERALMRADLLSVGFLPRDELKPLTDSVLSAILQTSTGRISLLKILGVSFFSTVLFLLSLTGSLPISSVDAPLTAYFGGGILGAALASALVYFAVWPTHFLYDLVCSTVLLRVWRWNEHRRLVAKSAIVSATTLSLSIAPFFLALWAYIYRFGYGHVVDPKAYQIGDYIVLAPFVFNGPVLLWILFAAALFSGGVFTIFGPGQWIILLLSCCSTGVVLLSIGVVRALGGSKYFARIVARTLRTLSERNAGRLFQYSLIAFTIGNGLCQIFGISVSLAPSK